MGGIYGRLLALSANWLFLLVFGIILDLLGATKFFIHLSKLLAAKLHTGTGITTTFADALIGMVTGGGGQAVTITGSFAIPLMLRADYTLEEAAALTASATRKVARSCPR